MKIKKVEFIISSGLFLPSSSDVFDFMREIVRVCESVDDERYNELAKAMREANEDDYEYYDTIADVNDLLVTVECLLRKFEDIRYDVSDFNVQGNIFTKR